MTGESPHARSDDGFTLVELLVTILIVALLAAIAIPSFLNERGKASDAGAKSTLRQIATAMQTYATDHEGSFACGDSSACASAVGGIENAIPLGGVSFSGPGGNPTADVYRVTLTSSAGRTFWLQTTASAGTTDRGCDIGSASSAGGCRLSGGTSGRW